MSATTGIGVAAEDRSRLSRAQNRAVRRRSTALLASLVRPVRWRIALAVLLVVVSQLAAVAGPLLIAYGIDTALPRAVAGRPASAVLAVGLFVVTAVLQSGLMGLFVRTAARIGQSLLLDLRVRIFRHTQRLGLDFHERYTSGRIISRQTNDLESIGQLLDSGLDDLLSGVFFMVFTIIALASLDVPSALVLVAGLVPLVPLLRWFRAESIVVYRQSSSASARLVVRFVETMTGIRAVQAFRRQRANQHRYEDESDHYRSVQEHGQRAFTRLFTAIVLVGNTTVGVLVIVNGLRVLDGTVGVGVLMAAVLYARQFFQPVESIGTFYNALQAAAAALEKISGVLAERPSVVEPAEPARPRRVAGEVVFDRVAFGYGDETVVPELSLRIPAGQTVALVGTTGAGKTTLAKLIARFYDPTSGAVELDGVDLRRLADADLRRQLVMVTQEAYLFGGSVAENIAIGRVGATRAEIEEAAAAVGADAFIRALPDGYDTDVRKRGGRLSAGQQQLVSFARAFLADPRVLILDEATSSLDIPSERQVQDSLQRLLADRTAVIIAHRLSTVGIADRILVLEHGRVVEDGAPAELAAGSGRFGELHRAWRESLA